MVIYVLIYTWTNIWSLGYFGVFKIIVINYIFGIAYLFSEFYYIWVECLSIDISLFLWSEMGNNIFIFLNFKVDLFSYILSLIVVLGYFFVINFVFIELYEDKEGANFIINLGFFANFMLLLTISGNLLVFYLGWEGIGITSLILVTYWSERTRSIKASFKIYLINRIGDYIIFLFLCIIINFTGDIDFDTINSMIPLLINYNFYNFNLVELLGVLLVLGTSIKSAQFGFHIWLLEAMEAPLGASALMHSSTLVVSGFVLIFKLSSLLELSAYSQILMFLMGSFSATFGSLIACFQYELKTIMAYSTISNMGYMFILLSLTAYTEAIFLLITHAFIKIFMFLVVGSIIVHCNGCQDIRWMGGLMLYIPSLWVFYTYGGFCLIGLPYLSGYYCKQYILTSLSNSFVLFRGVDIILMLSFFFTAVYVTRSSYLIFLGPKNGHRKIYNKKVTTLGTIFDLFFLSTISLFSYAIVIIILNTSFYSVYINIFSKSLYFFNYINYDINNLLYWQWFIFYWLKILIFLCWCYYTHWLIWAPIMTLFVFKCLIFLRFLFHIIYIKLLNV